MSFSRDAFNAKLQAKRARDSEDRFEAWVALAGQCLLEAFAAKSGVGGKLRYAVSSRNVSERFSDKGRIVTCFLEAGFEVHRDFLRSLKAVRAIPFV